jgi:hypothetical protein
VIIIEFFFCVIIECEKKEEKKKKGSAPSSQLPVALDFRPSPPQSRIFGASHCSRMARRRAAALLPLRLRLTAIPF